MKLFKTRNIIFAFILAVLLHFAFMLNPLYFKGESPNYNKEKNMFFNSFEPPHPPVKGTFADWRKERKSKDYTWKRGDIERFTVYEKYERREKVEGFSAVFVGHATFLLQLEGINILTDPIWSERASPVKFAGPKRVTKPGIPFEELPKIDYVLITHSHYDHMDIPTIKRLKKAFDPIFITGLGNCHYLNKMRRLGLKCEEKDWGQGTIVREGFEIVFEKAYHWTQRTLYDRNRSLWGGFVIKSPRFKVFYAGDTGYATHFKKIRDEYGAFDAAFLPIGAYEPRWFMKNSHMNPDDAVQAHLDLAAKKSIGMHFKAFQLTDESFNKPVEDLEEAKKKYSIKNDAFTAPNIGERISF